MLSKNFEYTGQRLYLSNIALPISAAAGFGHRVAQRETLAFERDVAQPFVGRAIFVGRFGRAGEPALVDAAAMGAVSVPIGRGELDPLAGMQEAARHPGGSQPQQPAAGVQRRGSAAATLSRFRTFSRLKRSWRAAVEEVAIIAVCPSPRSSRQESLCCIRSLAD